MRLLSVIEQFHDRHQLFRSLRNGMPKQSGVLRCKPAPGCELAQGRLAASRERISTRQRKGLIEKDPSILRLSGLTLWLPYFFILMFPGFIQFLGENSYSESFDNLSSQTSDALPHQLMECYDKERSKHSTSYVRNPVFNHCLFILQSLSLSLKLRFFDL